MFEGGAVVTCAVSGVTAQNCPSTDKIIRYNLQTLNFSLRVFHFISSQAETISSKNWKLQLLLPPQKTLSWG